jgi:hypothetical protein
MIELPDDELDKLFRKSSEELDPQFDPEDWNSLKKRLDQHDGRTAGWWFKKWWPLGLLLLLIPAGIASYSWLGDAEQGPVTATSKLAEEVNAADKANTTEQDRTPAIEATKGESTAAEIDDEGAVAAGNNYKTEDKGIEREEGAPTKTAINTSAERRAVIEKRSVRDRESKNRDISKKLPRSLSKAGGVYLEPNRSNTGGGDGALILPGTREELISDSKGTNASELGARQAIGSDRVDRAPHTVAEQSGYPNAGTSEAADERVFVSASSLKSRPLQLTSPMAYPGIHAFVAEAPTGDAPFERPDENESKSNDLAESSKWAVRLGYSPDLTTVGFKNLTKPGSAFSLLFEYGVSPRLYLQTGVVRSIKDYYAPASEYKLNKYVTQINTPYAVDGTCTMFEVPLGIRYDIAQKAHSRWFAGTGFSSYYAQKEKYNYRYEKYVHLQKPGWEGKTGWYFLSHLNASVGYERTITRKLSILAEPFVRIPLKGVGYGKVNLTTAGMWLSLRYTPVFR